VAGSRDSTAREGVGESPPVATGGRSASDDEIVVVAIGTARVAGWK